MIVRTQLLTLIRVIAIAATISGAALMGHSGITAAHATPAVPPAATLATAAEQSDKDNDCDQDQDKDNNKDRDNDEDKANEDQDEQNENEEEECATSSAGGASAAPAPAAPAPSGAVSGAHAVAPVTGVPKTGADLPFGVGLALTGSGLAALAAGRRLRRRRRP